MKFPLDSLDSSYVIYPEGPGKVIARQRMWPGFNLQPIMSSIPSYRPKAGPCGTKYDGRGMEGTWQVLPTHRYQLLPASYRSLPASWLISSPSLTASRSTTLRSVRSLQSRPLRGEWHETRRARQGAKGASNNRNRKKIRRRSCKQRTEWRMNDPRDKVNFFLSSPYSSVLIMWPSPGSVLIMSPSLIIICLLPRVKEAVNLVSALTTSIVTLFLKYLLEVVRKSGNH